MPLHAFPHVLTPSCHLDVDAGSMLHAACCVALACCMCWRPLVLVRSRNHDGLDHDFMSNPPLGSQASPPPRNNTSLWRFSQELGECAKYLKAARVHHAAGYMVRCSWCAARKSFLLSACRRISVLCSGFSADGRGWGCEGCMVRSVLKWLHLRPHRRPHKYVGPRFISRPLRCTPLA